MKGMIKTLKRGFGFNTGIYSLLLVVCSVGVIGYALSRKYLGRGDFIEGIAVEAFGMLFDILVLGLIFSIFYNLGENRRNIQRYLEEIDDLRGWQDQEAMFRHVGNIKRLVRLGQKNLPLQECYLENATLGRLDLHGANLELANLQDAGLQWANLQEADLEGAYLLRVYLQGANLFLANLYLADLQEAYLEEADLKGADLREAILEGAFLYRADLSEANGLTIEQLLEAKSLYQVKGLDPKLKAELKKRKPKLFKKPKFSWFELRFPGRGISKDIGQR